MRLWSLMVWDIRLQMKSGFYLIYGILTTLYLAILFAIPTAWREAAAAICIFSDPAAMGLFFMGAIILLEKSQKLPSAFATSPVRANEYIVAKVASLSLIALAVASVLAIAARVDNLPYTLLGTALASVIFSLLGIIIASNITSLNQFILWTVPIELIALIPAILHLFGIYPNILRYYPTSVCMDMITGKQSSIIGLFIVVLLIASLLVIAHKCVLQMWQSAGGVKL